MREQQDGNVEDRYRHVRHHPVFGSLPGSRGAGAGRLPRRAGAGPRLVRPAVVPVPSRPVQPRRPVPVEGRVAVVLEQGPSASAGRARLRSVGGSTGPRVLRRRSRPAMPVRGRFLARRLIAGAVLVVVAALAVLGLGLLADAVSAVRSPAASVPAPSTSSVVIVEAPGTVWDVAGRLEPGASPAERAALVGRIVTANSLATGEVRPGQVLAVPSR